MAKIWIDIYSGVRVENGDAVAIPDNRRHEGGFYASVTGTSAATLTGLPTSTRELFAEAYCSGTGLYYKNDTGVAAPTTNGAMPAGVGYIGAGERVLLGSYSGAASLSLIL